MSPSTHQHKTTLTKCTLNQKVGDKPIKQVNQAKLLGIIKKRKPHLGETHLQNVK